MPTAPKVPDNYPEIAKEIFKKIHELNICYSYSHDIPSFPYNIGDIGYNSPQMQKIIDIIDNNSLQYINKAKIEKSKESFKAITYELTEKQRSDGCLLFM